MVNLANRSIGVALGLSLVISGCALGPEYEKPQTAAWQLPEQWEQQLQSDSTPSAWWTLFEDPQLEAWIRQALQENRHIAQAYARWQAAQALSREQSLERTPQIGAQGSYQNDDQLQPSTQERAHTKQWRGGLSMNWELDLFSRLASLEQASAAQAQASRADWQQWRATVAAEVARGYFRGVGLTQQAQIWQQNIDSWKQTMAIQEQQLALGRALPEELAQSQAEYRQSLAQLHLLNTALDQQYAALAVLRGQSPESGQSVFPAPVNQVLLTRLPVGEVGALLQNRPDVQAAERRLAASGAQVAAAKADLYPRISLGAFLGFFALRAGDLGSTGASSLGLDVDWPALRMANVHARLRAQEAGQDAALAQYQQALLQAQQELFSSVSGLLEQQGSLQQLLQAGQHARQAWQWSQRRYELGAGSYLHLLQAQRQYLTVRLKIQEAETASYEYAIAMYQALAWGVEGSD